MLRFRCDHVANTLSVTTNRNRASPLLADSPTEQRLTALHSRSPPQRTYGLLQTRPRGSFAAQPAALKPPGQFRAAPLPHRCRVPSVRAPGQDFHLRSQHPYSAHQGQAFGPRWRAPLTGLPLTARRSRAVLRRSRVRAPRRQGEKQTVRGLGAVTERSHVERRLIWGRAGGVRAVDGGGSAAVERLTPGEAEAWSGGRRGCAVGGGPAPRGGPLFNRRSWSTFRPALT
jgi:hypothetical protein